MSPAKEKSRPATRSARGKAKAAGVAAGGQALERRPAREGEPEQPRALVDRLAGGVVERAAQDGEPVVRVHARQEGVAPGGDEAQEGRRERRGRAVPAPGDEVRGDVALQVVDGRQREVARGGQALRGRHAHEEGADEPRPLRDGDEVDVVEPGAGAGQGVVDDRRGELEVVAGGDLGHDAAVAVVHPLARDDVRVDRAVVPDDRRAGVVAARLEREDHAGAGPVGSTGPAAGMSSRRPSSVAGVRHMMSASSPLSW